MGCLLRTEPACGDWPTAASTARNIGRRAALAKGPVGQVKWLTDGGEHGEAHSVSSLFQFEHCLAISASGSLDAKLVQPVVECGAVNAKSRGGPRGPADHPFRLAQDAEDVFALNRFEG